ncbi:MAG: S9 family peptidase [Bacteroidetes bacterium]|nr:MAG: S9 family peptidase [Bacteroidota bacterium]
MRYIFIALVALCSLPSFSQLTVETIMQDPKWIGTQPSNYFWHASKPQLFFYWNPNKAIADSQYAVTAGNWATPQLQSYMGSNREVARANATYNNSRTAYTYSFNGDIFYVEVATQKEKKITHTTEIESQPCFSFNGTCIVYTKGQQLYAWHMADGTTKQLTQLINKTEAGNKKLTKQDDWLQNQQLMFTYIQQANEKKEARKRIVENNKLIDTVKVISIGEKQVQQLQISPGGQAYTYKLVTPAANNKNTIVPNYVTETGYTTDLNTRTKVGNAQAQNEWFMYLTGKDSLVTISTKILPNFINTPHYAKYFNAKGDSIKAKPSALNFFGPVWNTSGSYGLVDVRSLDNKNRWLVAVNSETGVQQLVSHQTDTAWIGGPGISSFNPSMGWLNDTVCYFQSEETGYSHLYSFALGSSQQKALTQGSFEIQKAVLNQAKNGFFILANKKHPGKQGIYFVSLANLQWKTLQDADGGYDFELSADEKYLAYRYSTPTQPWELFVLELKGKENNAVQVTNKAASAEWKSNAWLTPQVLAIPTADGNQVYARVYQPEPNKRNGAAVFFVHGAGYLQNAHHWWSQYFREYMFHNLLVQQGFTVLDIDYRASSGYGKAWRTGIYRHMGGKDLTDHIDAVNYAVKNLGVNPNRIGIYGGSYGGFITLMALFTTPTVFKAGAALRPVTDWAHYNHGYTSNILNEPFTDSLAYARSSPINFAKGLQNHLLICHGMVDVNVHFQDVVRLSQRLIELQKNNWELAVYPIEDHGFTEPTSWIDEYKRILKLFKEKL